MKLKRNSLIVLILGLFISISGLITPFVYWKHNGAIGIIGGADTLTYEFVVFRLMNGWPFCAILFGTTLIISALLCLIFSKTVKNNCKVKTTAISLGLSAVGALGLVCAFLRFTTVSFREMSKHPIEYPVSVLLGIFCLFAFIVLIALYFKMRKMNWSIKGVVIDVLTSIVYLPTFFFTFSCLYEILS